ncbi:MAG TPA: SRPBCC family protein [Phycisphaerae bacterium]|jgi:carbon monoxide dehydrogenase subunit G
MAIEFEHAIDLKAEPARVFALLDDLPQTPKWLASCVAIEKLTPGPNVVGDKLKYSYKESGRQGVMDGVIEARSTNQRLLVHYWDKMMDVTVEYLLAASAGGGTRLVHKIAITPKTFMAKMFTPMIRKGLPKQTTAAMESLRKLLGE